MIYIYTVRDIRIDGTNRFAYMIPKLYDYILGDYPNESVSLLIERLSDYTNDELLDWLFGPNCSIFQSEYIIPEDILFLIQINRTMISQLLNSHPSRSFRKTMITHLFQSHGNMEYGMYFSLIHANDDVDFISKFQRIRRVQSDQKTIYFTTLRKLCNHIRMIDSIHTFSPLTLLLYMNRTWQYGKLEEDSIYLTKSNGLDIDAFISQLESIPFTGKEELICKLPLPIELFSFFFVDQAERLGLSKRRKSNRRKRNTKKK